MESPTPNCRQASPPPTANRPPSTEDGFTLAALLVILTIISIVVAATVPEQWSKVMQRERDKQTIFMMKQAARAIKVWREKNGNAPPGTLDQLKEAKMPRLLRLVGKDFPMPHTGKEEDWILVPENAIEVQPPPPPTNPPSTLNLPPPSKLRKELSPDDYKGPFVAIRPRLSGPSFLSLNGAEDYSEWVFTAQDAANEIQMRLAPLNTP
jgi:type II secretory pathway pseudopilin PulG